MALEENERIQEIALMAGDKISQVNRNLWLLLAATIVFAVPGYFLAKGIFVNLAMVTRSSPQIIYNPGEKKPLQITDKGIFDLGDDYYSAFVRIENIEHDWGVASQGYMAEFKTMGGTSITKVNGSAFILPQNKKFIIFNRFHSTTKPEQFVFNLDETKFIHKPLEEFDFDLERETLNNPSTGLIVSAGIKNLTPFTVKQVNLPVAVYNASNQVVAVNFTSINDLLAGETRTFQYSWTKAIPGAIRAEIMPEVNVFDSNIFQIEAGGPSF